MKQLSTEEKAQRYDKALDEAKALHEAIRKDLKSVIEQIFPELEESEDEKIRKWLISQLEIKSDVNNPRELELMILKSIAWLGKQGEQKSSWTEEDDEFVKIMIADTEGLKRWGIMNKDILNDRINWFKSLKDKCNQKSSIKWNENTEENKPPVNHSILMKTDHGIAEGEWRGDHWCQYRWATTHIKDSHVLAWMELSDLNE